MSEAQPVEDRIRKHIAENFVTGDATQSLGADEELGLDSLNVLKMVSFVEEEFAISVEDEELVPENFETIGAIRDLVAGKLSDTPV